MKSIKVDVNNKAYNIFIEQGLIKSSGKYVKDVTDAKTICLISDTNVHPIYGGTVEESLKSSGFNVITYVYPAGEESKNTATVIKMVEFMAEHHMTRDDCVLALGGGVCGDMAGFAASIYLRGIEFVQIPTTLLAQVDSSVGGKTAVDLPQGKNLCGAFHQPILVLIDIGALDTLSPHFFSDGMGEVIKYGCIKSPSLFEKLEQSNAKDFIEDIILECVDIKRELVENDEKERGERALLNFGHTPGHAIEKLYDFKGISHGEAIGIGMVIMTKACEEHSVCPVGTAGRISNVLKKNGLKTADSHTLEEIIGEMSADKKRTGKGIKLVKLKSIGSSFVDMTPYDKINDFFGVKSK